MAKDALGEILLLGGLAVGGYFVWQWFSGMSATSATPVTTANPRPPRRQLPGSRRSRSRCRTRRPQTRLFRLKAGKAMPTNGRRSGRHRAAGADKCERNLFPEWGSRECIEPGQHGGEFAEGLPLMSLSTFLTNLSATGVKGLSGVPNLMNYLTRLQMQQLARGGR